MNSLYASVFAFFIALILIGVFFSKERIKSNETSVYGWLIGISLLHTVIVSIAIVVSTQTTDLFMMTLLNRVETMIVYSYLLLLLVYVIIYSVKTKKVAKAMLYSLIVLSVISFFAMLLLPIEFPYFGESYTTIGPLKNFIIAVVSAYGLSMVTLIIYNIVHEKKKLQFVPILIFAVLATINILIKIYVPLVYIDPIVIAIVNLSMYFTIENPDIKLMERLNIAKVTAERANLAKSDFLSSMSHEIRTPLNGIVGFSEAIKDATTLEEAKADAEDIVTSSSMLLEIVNGILDISKIEAGKLELKESDYNLHKVVEEVKTLTKTKIGTKNIVLTTSISEDTPKALFGDRLNVKKILLNLMTNAAKYTEQGSISLEIVNVLKGDNIRLIVKVKDTGRGMTKEHLKELFTKFNRLEAENTNIEGTGLGLVITKQLVEMMNGHVSVKSEYGIGSEFMIAIDQKISINQNIEEEKEILDITPINLYNKKILLVDDNTINLKVATKLLMAYNLNVTTSMTGYDCIDKVKKEQFDLILLDDMMPEISGVDTLELLKQIQNFNTPVIALTANALSGMKEYYLEKGFNDYLAKPIDKTQLYRVLITYLNENKIDII